MNLLAEAPTTSVDPKSFFHFGGFKSYSHLNIRKATKEAESRTISREEIRDYVTGKISDEQTLFNNIQIYINSTVTPQPLSSEANSTLPFVDQFELAYWHSMQDQKWQKLLKKLVDYSKLTEGWNGYTAPPPSILAVRNSRSFLALLGYLNFFPDRLKPSVVGGIAFTFRRGTRKVYVEFFNEGGVYSLFSDSVSDPITKPTSASRDGYLNLSKHIQEYLNG